MKKPLARIPLAATPATMQRQRWGLAIVAHALHGNRPLRQNACSHRVEFLRAPSRRQTIHVAPLSLKTAKPPVWTRSLSPPIYTIVRIATSVLAVSSCTVLLTGCGTSTQPTHKALAALTTRINHATASEFPGNGTAHLNHLHCRPHGAHKATCTGTLTWQYHGTRRRQITIPATCPSTCRPDWARATGGKTWVAVP